MSEWISVDDHLPTPDDDYWVFSKKNGVCRWYIIIDNKWYEKIEVYDEITLCLIENQNDITHWIPFIYPEPPENHE